MPAGHTAYDLRLTLAPSPAIKCTFNPKLGSAMSVDCECPHCQCVRAGKLATETAEALLTAIKDLAPKVGADLADLATAYAAVITAMPQPWLSSDQTPAQT